MKNRYYFRENIQRMKGYEPGFQPAEDGWLKLNTNENPYPPSPKVLKTIKNSIDLSLALYPSPTAEPVRQKIARLYRLKPETILVGNGSDEVLSIISRSFLEKGRTLLITEPTYSLYEVLARIQNAKIKKIKLNPDFTLSENIFKQKADLTIISNPNPPAGTLFSKIQMNRLCKTAGGIVVIDEAYVDFSTKNCLGLLKKYDNLIIVRTLSKSFFLAGLRVGFAIARQPIIEGMMKVKDSYNVNYLSQIAAVAVLDDIRYFKNSIRKICQQREFLSNALRILGFKVFPSQANFILAQPPKVAAAKFYQELYKQKVLVRFFDTPNLRKYLRITIGTPEQMQEFLKAVKLSMVRFKIKVPEASLGVVKY